MKSWASKIRKTLPNKTPDLYHKEGVTTAFIPRTCTKHLWVSTNIHISTINNIKHTQLLDMPSLAEPSLVPRPHPREERVWWRYADPSDFINIDYFLERNFPPPITLQKTQSVVQHRNTLLLCYDDMVLFWQLSVLNYAYGKLWIFNKV